MYGIWIWPRRSDLTGIVAVPLWLSQRHYRLGTGAQGALEGTLGRAAVPSHGSAVNGSERAQLLEAVPCCQFAHYFPDFAAKYLQPPLLLQNAHMSTSTPPLNAVVLL
jgi:hypothetical protein